MGIPDINYSTVSKGVVSMKKILFLIPSLGGGGAERVLVNLVNNLALNKYDITVETMFSGGTNQKLLRDDIHYSCAGARLYKGISHLYKVFPSRLLYNRFIGNSKYDLLIAYRSGVATKVICGCPDNNTVKITWLHHGDSEHSSYFTPWLTKKGAFVAYSKLDAVVGVANSVISSFEIYTGINGNTYVLYNTNDTKRIELLLSNGEGGLKSEENRLFTIISVGRLEHIKGFDRLIHVAHKLVKNGYNINLEIVGDGSQREALEKLIYGLDMNERVKLVGFTENPYSLMADADLFVCSSLKEGLSTVITESLICGTPVVSTDVSGAKEVLGYNNEYGMVVENSEEGIYNGIIELIDNPERLQHYRSVAKQRGYRFSTQNTVNDTEQLFDELCNKQLRSNVK